MEILDRDLDRAAYEPSRATEESVRELVDRVHPEAESQHVRRLYEGIGLNRRQIQILATALPKRQYYVMSSLGRRLIGLGLGPVALSFVGMAGREALVQVNEQMAAHGRRWPATWLRGRGLEVAAEAWMRYFEEEGGNLP